MGLCKKPDSCSWQCSVLLSIPGAARRRCRSSERQGRLRSCGRILSNLPPSYLSCLLQAEVSALLLCYACPVCAYTFPQNWRTTYSTVICCRMTHAADWRMHAGCTTCAVDCQGAIASYNVTQSDVCLLCRMLSPDEACKSFDAGGNGYARAEGVASVILRRSDVADTPTIIPREPYARVLGIGTNNDGHTEQGITFPSGAAQKALGTAVHAKT